MKIVRIAASEYGGAGAWHEAGPDNVPVCQLGHPSGWGTDRWPATMNTETGDGDATCGHCLNGVQGGQPSMAGRAPRRRQREGA